MVKRGGDLPSLFHRVPKLGRLRKNGDQRRHSKTVKSFATTFHVAKVSTCRSLLSRCHALFRRLGRYQWVARFRCSFGKPTKSDEGQRKSNCLQALKRTDPNLRYPWPIRDARQLRTGYLHPIDPARTGRCTKSLQPGLLALATFFCIFPVGCGGSNAEQPTIASSEVAVSVDPPAVSLSVSQTQQFTATVTSTSNKNVTWDVNGVAGGTATGVLTYHNDNSRTGQNLNESVLSPANVTQSKFGKLFSYPLDGQVFAQPLYVYKVPIDGQNHNVIYVATEHDTVYAFDADNKASSALWSVSFLNSAEGVT